MKFIFILALVLISVRSQASFDRLYEYRSFSLEEAEVINYFDKIDEEYTSDILTYSFSPEVETQFHKSDRIFLASLGSLSRSEFMKDMRLKIKRNLSSHLGAHFIHIEQKDYETSQSHSIFELIWRAHRRWKFSSFADLDFSKVNDNVGFSLAYQFSLDHEVKVFYNMVQFDRNKRNRADDRFEKKPFTYGFIGRRFKERFGLTEYLEYGFINESETQWVFPSNDLRISYQRWMGTIRYVRPVGSSEVFSFFYQIDKRSDGREEFLTSIETARLDLLRNQLQVHYLKKDYEKFDFEVGAYFVSRNAEILTGKRDYYDLLPYITAHFNRNKDSAGYWSLGYDVDLHYVEHAAYKHKEGFAHNHRANILWTANFKNAYLRFAATLDVDDLSWEGGNGQFQMEF